LSLDGPHNAPCDENKDSLALQMLRWHFPGSDLSLQRQAVWLLLPPCLVLLCLLQALSSERLSLLHTLGGVLVTDGKKAETNHQRSQTSAA
jgi:hypothetical protein